MRDGPAARVAEAPEIINGIFYVHAGGPPVAPAAEGLAAMGTIYRWFAAWRDDGRFEQINHALVMADREGLGATPALGRDY